MLRHSPFALVLALALFACFDDEDDAAAPGPAADGGTANQPSNEAGPTADGGAASDLEGTWLTPCVQEASKWYGHWRLVMKDGVASALYRQYKSDPSCSDESKLAVDWPQVSRNWTIGDRSATPTPLERTFDSSRIKVVDAELKSIWDTTSSCGPHALGVAEDVTGKTCWNQWQAPAGGIFYDVITFFDADSFALGLSQPGRNGKTPEARAAVVDMRMVFTREGVEPGFIEATIDGALVRANKKPTTPSVSDDFVQISAATENLPPWKTFVLQIPRAAGTYTCKTAPSPTSINYGFTQDNLPVYWDTEQSGGNDCTLTITKAASGKGDTIEGTFSGVLGDGNGNGHNATNGSFKIRLTQ